MEEIPEVPYKYKDYLLTFTYVPCQFSNYFLVFILMAPEFLFYIFNSLKNRKAGAININHAFTYSLSRYLLLYNGAL